MLGRLAQLIVPAVPELNPLSPASPMMVKPDRPGIPPWGDEVSTLLSNTTVLVPLESAPPLMVVMASSWASV